jgi:RNA polymerase subunit RPABC4/transcription elongation factor Spt4
MNLICPSCGCSGNEDIFHKIGQKKLLCSQCKAILQLALKCPACDGIISMPFISLPHLSGLKRFLGFRFSSKSFRKLIKCPVCDYEAGTEKFERVVVFKEEYSVIYTK